MVTEPINKKAEQARPPAQALLAQGPDVILVNGTPGLAALRALDSTIPVVFVVETNPVGAGFVDSLARPGGNITGFSTFEPEIGSSMFKTSSVVIVGALALSLLEEGYFFYQQIIAP